jgi:ferrous iron transport protein A
MNEEAKLLPLSEIGVSKRATVVSMQGGRGMHNRLLGMGLNIGSKLEVLKCNGGRGGPMLVAVGQTRLAIGRGMADKIIVTVENNS